MRGKRIYILLNTDTKQITPCSNLKTVWISISKDGTVEINRLTVNSYVSFWRKTFAENRLDITVKKRNLRVRFEMQLAIVM